VPPWPVLLDCKHRAAALRRVPRRSSLFMIRCFWCLPSGG
jgi:hypothetical protein